MRGIATAVDLPLVTSPWAMPYAYDTAVVPQSPEQLRKIMVAIIIVCTVSGLIVPEAKTEGRWCLQSSEMPGATAKPNVKVAIEVYTQGTILYQSRETSATTPTCLSKSTGVYATADTVSRSTTPSRCSCDDALGLRHMEFLLVPLRCTMLSSPQFIRPLYQMEKAKLHRPLDFLTQQLCENRERGYRGGMA